MADAVTVRPLAASDEDDWRRLWRGYLDFYRTTLDEAVYQATFTRLLDPADEHCHGLLAVTDDGPLGLVHYLYHAHLWRLEPVCYLQDLYVDGAARGRGAGRALIEAVYAAADARGAASVYWLTQEDNRVARRLYDRIGSCTPFIKYTRP